jgi:hypothetical protein
MQNAELLGLDQIQTFPEAGDEVSFKGEQRRKGYDRMTRLMGSGAAGGGARRHAPMRAPKTQTRLKPELSRASGPDAQFHLQLENAQNSEESIRFGRVGLFGRARASGLKSAT